jgi:opacity protein-like surface antigen
MKKFVAALAFAAFAISVAGQASAADLPRKAPAVVHDPCGIQRFSGVYVGGNVGGIAYVPTQEDLDGFFTDNSGWTAHDIAVTAGVQVGYDWQSCNKVFGVVADWNWTNAHNNWPDNPNSPSADNFESKMRWFSTLRARAGLAVNDALVYITGGLAAARIDHTLSENGETFSLDKTRWGGVGGVGAEVALGNNLSLNAEVLYMQFAKQSVTFVDQFANTRTFDFNDSAWVTRVGLNYRWGGARAAYAAAMPVKSAASYNPCGLTRFNGGYVGGNFGTIAYTAETNDLDGFLTDNSNYTATDLAWTAGAQVGYDWQSCNRVFGIVADWNWTNAKTETLDNPNNPGDNNSTRKKMDWFATLRGRAGLAVNDSLVYVTGGVAAAKIATTISDPPDTFDTSKTRWGLVGGVGAEFALWNNWSVNTEILYLQFAKQSETFADTGGTLFAFDLHDSAWVSRVGLNYRWGGANAAYAAATPSPCGPARFSGGYVGGNVGGNFYSAKRNDLDGFLVDNSGWTATDIAPTAGVQAGYDWQSCNRVFGIVADWNWTNAKTSTLNDPNGVGNGGIDSKMDWFATLRTRAGLAVNDTLVYVTGGIAAAKIATTITETPDIFDTSKTRWGLVGCAGAEYVFGNNWSVAGEVLYMQFKKQEATFADTGATLFSFEYNDSAWVGRVALNYRWGAIPAPSP